jgi:predicted transcriptional regulator
MSAQKTAKNRAAMLKRLREEHADSVARTQALLKEQNKTRKAICNTIRESAKTVPQIAEAIDMPSSQVLWHLTAYKKYDLVMEDGMCDEYVLYKWVKEEK